MTKKTRSLYAISACLLVFSDGFSDTGTEAKVQKEQAAKISLEQSGNGAIKIIKAEEGSALKGKDGQTSGKAHKGTVKKVTGDILKKEAGWTQSFNIDECDFSATGKNQYFILLPGYQQILKSVEEADSVTLVITVTNETRTIGKIKTRVVEERETVNGIVAEVSWNYFAICTQTNSVFYFGEDVDIYKNGKIASHDGAWRADSGGAQPGLMMPGVILLGARYYQEVAPGVAMDRAEIVSNDKITQAPAGRFERCLVIEETTPLEPKTKETKIYAPNVGLIKDGNLSLTSFTK